MNIGKIIKGCRERQGLSQGDLVIIINSKYGNNAITNKSISMIECGHRDGRISTLNMIANGLNIPLSRLIEMAERELAFATEGNYHVK